MSIQPEEVVSVVRDVLQQPEVAQSEVAPVSPNKQHLTPQQQRKQARLVEKPRIMKELVIEEISIDGMCGVY
jgi:mycofactocin precursor